MMYREWSKEALDWTPVEKCKSERPRITGNSFERPDAHGMGRNL